MCSFLNKPSMLLGCRSSSFITFHLILISQTSQIAFTIIHLNKLVINLLFILTTGIIKVNFSERKNIRPILFRLSYDNLVNVKKSVLRLRVFVRLQLKSFLFPVPLNLINSLQVFTS